MGGLRPFHTINTSLDVEGNLKFVLDGDRQQHGDPPFGPELRRVLARLQLRGDDEGRPFPRARAERVHVGRTNVDALGSLLLAFHRLEPRVTESGTGAWKSYHEANINMQQTWLAVRTQTPAISIDKKRQGTTKTLLPGEV